MSKALQAVVSVGKLWGEVKKQVYTGGSTAPMLLIEAKGLQKPLRKGMLIAVRSSGTSSTSGSIYVIAEITGKHGEGFAAQITGAWFTKPNQLSPKGSFESWHPAGVKRMCEINSAVYVVTGDARKDFMVAFQSAKGRK